MPAAVCINKVDLAPELGEQIRAAARELGLPVLGAVRYDPAVVQAQLEHRPVVVYDDSPAAADMRSLWQQVLRLIQDPKQATKGAALAAPPAGGDA